MQYSVDFAEVNLAGQLLDRQARHLEQFRKYGDEQFRIDASEFGLILGVLYPINEAVVALAGVATEGFKRATSATAQLTNETLDAYLQTDEQAHAQFNQIMMALGGSATKYDDPRDSFTELGAAESQAGSDYGVEAKSALPFENTVPALEDIKEATASLVTTTYDEVVERATTYTSRAGVSERTDPASYLVVTDPGDDPGGELRAKAGVILGGLDWVAHKVVGKSILEEYVYKPFGGNWHAIDRTSSAWGHGARFHLELAANFAGLPTQLQSWTGIASGAFQVSMAAFAAASFRLNLAYEAVSGYVSIIGTISKLVCSEIAKKLREISHDLTALAIMAAVPVVGWAGALIKGVKTVDRIIKTLDLIVNLINLLLEAIAEFIEGKERVVQASLLIEDLVNNFANRAVAAQ